ncbi:Veg family protein [Oenococcus kitaharae]|uniref:Veg protein n=1 Tax=Oenococcus kitaharae DSM 17330 TaxID=1045004 RepID=G9WEQ8_9LACO|nr:Veg family protein [Oenococcus kitaharae]EHN58231.1 Veg protein [Oenococcus kitaharae DSM 17330]MCV3296528.1 Veg family protein [Oenococcus kitaharae]OEY81582.1 veg [Oenococcus kitaharae]OEY83068.1 veg [Oenococcus kitaharae]OEY84386.1 veg [Oenococcus kitaharae]
MPEVLQNIKDDLDSKIGSQITVIAQAGRKKTTTRKGVLLETYPSLFVVQLDKAEGTFERVSYSYTDILTKNIDINFGREVKSA